MSLLTFGTCLLTSPLGILCKAYFKFGNRETCRLIREARYLDFWRNSLLGRYEDALKSKIYVFILCHKSSGILWCRSDSFWLFGCCSWLILQHFMNCCTCWIIPGQYISCPAHADVFGMAPCRWRSTSCLISSGRTILSPVIISSSCDEVTSLIAHYSCTLGLTLLPSSQSAVSNHLGQGLRYWVCQGILFQPL